MEITIRSNPAENCFWALISGPGEVWMERTTPYSELVDSYVYPRTNKKSGFNHTKATVTTAHHVRACGRAYNGTETNGSSLGGGIDVGKKDFSVSLSGGIEHTDTYEFADATVCTEWAHPDVIIPNF